MCMGALAASISVCHLHAVSPEARREYQIPKVEVTDSLNCHKGAGNQTWILWEEKLELL